MVANLHPT